MKKAVLTLIALGAFALGAQAQTYQFRDQFGMPTGSAEYQSWNHSWQFRDQFGMPTGSAEYQRSNNSWEFRDQFGMPTGSFGR